MMCEFSFPQLETLTLIISPILKFLFIPSNKTPLSGVIGSIFNKIFLLFLIT